MKVDRKKLYVAIENVIGNGIWEGEAMDVTVDKVMEVIEPLIKAVENETLT